MAWVSTDREKIRRHLSIPSTMQALDELDFLMGSAAADQITTSQTAISKLDTLEATFETEASKNLAMIRADVIEYEAGNPEAKLSGVRIQQAYWKEQLSAALAYDGRFSMATPGGQATLLRS